ncbi:MAG: hypothetical protein ACJ75H_18365 [Thermoanaerobaculia bacterium]
MLLETLEDQAPPSPAAAPGTASGPGEAARSTVLRPWLRAQSLNVARHAAALRPFRRGEFGDGPESPTESHLKAANGLLSTLRRDLFKATRRVQSSVEGALAETVTPRLQEMVSLKARAHNRVRAVEQIWDFYFELFGQRQSRFGTWLLSCDRIALDCYQYAYLGLGKARSIPAPPPFSYMRTGFSPATFRRGIPLKKLGRQLNPFPLIQLPYHRLVNPWTLGAVLHEVCHNLQNDLGLARAVPVAIARRLLEAGLGRSVAAVWTRWNREIFADLGGLLLGGPAVVGSLMDVVGRDLGAVMGFSPGAPHPTPYLRTFLSVELLRRMGFHEEAEGYGRAWSRIYPDPRGGSIPKNVLDTWPRAVALVVDTICYRPYPSLGGKTLAQVIRFERKEQQMIEEAARRLASGLDPGIVPERFLIGATRFALDNRLARPGVITRNFYHELARR